ncbi:hypothetical protein [Streptomyces sp. NPDC050388]|uniref:hypothetical protein n=1 Tax=Streptomyces sp. NPDC050388 TaxID=3155781 RepID=UPI00343D2581
MRSPGERSAGHAPYGGSDHSDHSDGDRNGGGSGSGPPPSGFRVPVVHLLTEHHPQVFHLCHLR